MKFDLHGTSLGVLVDKPTSSACLYGRRTVEGIFYMRKLAVVKKRCNHEYALKVKVRQRGRLGQTRRAKGGNCDLARV